MPTTSGGWGDKADEETLIQQQKALCSGDQVQMKFIVRGFPRLIGFHEIYGLVALVRKFCSLWEYASAATRQFPAVHAGTRQRHGPRKASSNEILPEMGAEA